MIHYTNHFHKNAPMHYAQAQLLHALMTLSTKTRKELAERIGLRAQNVANALSGDRPFPKAKLVELFRELGLTDKGQLLEDVVHLWKLGAKVQPLSVAVTALFPRGANYAGFWRAGATPLDLTRAFDQPLIGITDGRRRVLVRSEGYGLFAKPEAVNHTTIPGLRSRLVHASNESRMIEISSTQFKVWERGDIGPSEFDNLLSDTRAERRS